MRIIPDPGGIIPELRTKMWSLVEKRVAAQGPPSLEDIEDLAPIAVAEMQRELWRAPREYHEAVLRKKFPEIRDEQIENVLKLIAKKRNEDPFVLDQPAQWGQAEIKIMRASTNLEMGLFIAQATGSFPYTNLRRRWKELLSVAQKLPHESSVWTPLTHAFQQLKFNFLNSVDPKFALSLHRDGRLEQFRAFLRKLWRTVNLQTDPNALHVTAREFSDELNDEFRKAQADWYKIDQDIVKYSVVAGGAAGAAIATGHMLTEIPTLGFFISEVGILLHAYFRKRTFPKNVPMSVFLDLSGRRSY